MYAYVWKCESLYSRPYIYKRGVLLAHVFISLGYLLLISRSHFVAIIRSLSRSLCLSYTICISRSASISVSICLYLSLFVSLCLSLSISLSISVNLSVSLSKGEFRILVILYLSYLQSLFVSLCLYLSVSISVSQCLSLSMGHFGKVVVSTMWYPRIFVYKQGVIYIMMHRGNSLLCSLSCIPLYIWTRP